MASILTPVPTVTLTVRRWLVPALLAVGLASCKNEVEKVEPIDTSYYPVQVGDFRIYEVTDTTWLRNVKTIARYQFREQVTEQYTDAAGRTAFRVVRSKRSTPADAWLSDSVLAVSPSAANVLVTRNNRRTVELVYPVRTGYFWNLNAFNELNPIEKSDIHFKQVGEPFTTTNTAGQSVTYPKTVTTALRETDAEEGGEYINLYYYYRNRQVYAPGIGPVYRSRRRFIYCADGNCIPSPSYIHSGSARTEILLESGK
ncbi:hypothetical protein KBK19_17130 [Microvirga sp. STR05]|uniref:DUF4249 domain-containing protein n=1 Tax=Hymenobacter duratus TaxID=2771356 RepID=A0ABR8JM22_9BACT|nr:hypothetical protein [Hymenobacter duratus]MBD2716771.1 hypothetical protein [Hymenobacter duratus]MBR7951686.1 hypothetical protein [Microvirga sp. STR05]